MFCSQPPWLQKRISLVPKSSRNLPSAIPVSSLEEVQGAALWKAISKPCCCSDKSQSKYSGTFPLKHPGRFRGLHAQSRQQVVHRLNVFDCGRVGVIHHAKCELMSLR